MKLLRVALAASALLLPVSVSAASITLGGGTTTVALDAGTVALLSGAGISVGPLGSASVMGTSAMFPITGGTIDTGTSQAELFHDGSGLRFSNMSANLDLVNFVINANVTPGSESGLLTGDAMGAVSASGVPLFTIGPNLTLTLRSEAAGALSAAFGLPNLTGAAVGVASVAPEAVPEPSTVVLLGGAGAVLGALRLRRLSA